MGDDQSRLLVVLDDIRHGESLPCAGGTQEDLVLIFLFNTFD